MNEEVLKRLQDSIRRCRSEFYECSECRYYNTVQCQKRLGDEGLDFIMTIKPSADRPKQPATTRPSKTDYYLDIALAVAKRGTCLRRQYGAVIVKDDVIISTGYNGAARNQPNCCDVGSCTREEQNIPHGERYELCKAVHAEANAILNGNRADMIGATLYLAGFEDGKEIDEPSPCQMCLRLIQNARIAKVVTRKGD